MAITEVDRIRGYLESLSRDNGENKTYYINIIREHLTSVDTYVSSLEDSVNILSTRIVASRDD